MAGGAEQALHRTTAEAFCVRKSTKSLLYGPDLPNNHQAFTVVGCPVLLLNMPAFMWDGDGLKVSFNMAFLLVANQPNNATSRAGRRRGETLPV